MVIVLEWTSSAYEANSVNEIYILTIFQCWTVKWCIEMTEWTQADVFLIYVSNQCFLNKQMCLRLQCHGKIKCPALMYCFCLSYCSQAMYILEIYYKYKCGLNE